MKFLHRIFGRETRSNTVSTSNPYLAEFLGERSGYGGYVDTNRASGLAVAQACVSVISQSLASVPMHLHRRGPNGGRERVEDHPLYTVLHTMANPDMTAYEAREMLITSLLTRGNAYARLIWNGRGQVKALYPLQPTDVQTERLESGRLRYRVTNQRGGVSIYLQEEILHLRDRIGRDGVTGVSRIQHCRDTFALALEQQQTAGKQAEKGYRARGVLTFPGSISADRKESAFAALADKVNSDAAKRDILLLDGGLDWKTMDISPRDAQFLESRKITNLDICRVFNIPPSAVGILDNATYSNVEQESRALVVRCLAPMARRIEQAMNAALLPEMSRKTLFVEHDLAGLLRGDLKARYEAYRIGREWGWLAPNEIRAWENLPEIKDGNEYLSPLNMVPMGERPGVPPTSEQK